VPNGNGATSKWIIALSISIILTIDSLAFAAVNGTKAGMIENHTEKIENNTTEIGILKTQTGIIDTKLEFILETVKEIKEVVKND
jgi:hypothetical protein